VNAHRTLQQLNQTWDKYTGSTWKRPLLFTEASWVGIGAHSVPLLTNYRRDWDSLKGMISSAYSLSMSGTRNFMVDSCGSLGKLDEELCLRWMQVATFMPMLRGYYNATYIDIKGNRVSTDP
jgi:alpha-glucosidase (family GH31 glycosyl hydrolase)